MPRVDSKNGGATQQLYNSASSNAQGQTSLSSPLHKKKHVCPTCDRAFTTSGHLARHSRVHTGEKNHKCPFPGCETRCSRQDNLQQHYRIHLSPGSRRTSSRSAASRRTKRGVSTVGSNSAGSGVLVPSLEQPPLSPPPLVQATLPPPPLSPPPLEQAHPHGPGARMQVYMNPHSPPPDSPPPLAQATLPATYHHAQQRVSPVPSSVSSPEIPYASSSSSGGSFIHSTGGLSMSPPPLTPAHSPTNGSGYMYRNGTSTYQEPSAGGNSGLAYLQTAPMGHSQSHTNSGEYATQYTLPRIETLSTMKEGSPTSLSAPVSAISPHSPLSGIHSRHSISHISHAQSYTPLNSHSHSHTCPPSPASSHSASQSVISTSGPPTPAGYTVYSDSTGAHSSYDQTGVVTSPTLSVHSPNSALPVLGPSLSRYDSPPLTLAPLQRFSHHDQGGNTMPRSLSSNEPSSNDVRVIQDQYDGRYTERAADSYRDRYEERYVSEDPRYMRYGNSDRSDLPPSYVHSQSQSMTTGYGGYAHHGGSVNLGHGAWKSDNLGSRGLKGIGALVQ